MNDMAEVESGIDDVVNGTLSIINGEQRIYYYGYWILYYEPPAETWTARIRLIEGLTRRTFHHTEAGINTPGDKLDLARKCYEEASNEQEKRVNGAMLAGALFNRATDIFKIIVELEDKGVHLSLENELMQECNECLLEAMKLGKMVRHVSGVEGIDELWGEPLKAFTMPLEMFYETRYVKISNTMRDIDRIVTELRECLSDCPDFKPLWPILDEFSNYAKLNSETIKRDPRWYAIWPKFVTNSENIEALVSQLQDSVDSDSRSFIIAGCKLIDDGKNLIRHISGARVPMPETTKRFMKQCEQYKLIFKNSDGNSHDT